MKVKFFKFFFCFLPMLGPANSHSSLPPEKEIFDLIASSNKLEGNGIEKKNSQSNSDCSSPSSLEAKVGYFFFTSSRMQRVYDEGGIDAQFSGTWGFWHWMRFYGSIEYLQKSGHSLNIHQHTSIWELPLSLGLQPWIPLFTSSDDLKKVAFYFTVGPRYFFVFVHNHSNYVDHKINENGIGGFANLGLFVSITPHLNLDFFGEYSYARLRFHSSHFGTQSHTVQIGGFTFGAALGYSF